ncbi:hypothetical protein ACWA2C_16835 [Priestia megaterium]
MELVNRYLKCSVIQKATAVPSSKLMIGGKEISAIVCHEPFDGRNRNQRFYSRQSIGEVVDHVVIPPVPVRMMAGGVDLGVVDISLNEVNTSEDREQVEMSFTLNNGHTFTIDEPMISPEFLSTLLGVDTDGTDK